MRINFKITRLAESLMWKCFAISGTRYRLRSGLTVSVMDKDEMATFREIFIQQDYDEFLERIPAPRTILDLGCNSGFFAAQILNRALIARQQTPKLVLIDASAISLKRATEVLQEGGMSSVARIEFQYGLIGKRGQKSTNFFLAPSSAESSAVHRAKKARAVSVPCVDLSALVAQHFPNGLDLIKCDIEGSEENLVREWQDVLVLAQSLLIEWHGFHGSQWQEFVAILSGLGFSLVHEHPAGRYKNALFVQKNHRASDY